MGFSYKNKASQRKSHLTEILRLRKFSLIRFNAITICLLLVTSLISCRENEAASQNWLIQSYENKIITVQHDGKMYKAKCDISRSFNNAPSVTDTSNVVIFQSCDLVIPLVGSSIQPFGGKQKDAEGKTIEMWAVGSTLALRSWYDEHSPWRQEEFVIMSVTKKP